MFTVEVRSSKNWRLRGKELVENKWSRQVYSSRKEAEVDIAWLSNSLEDVGHLLKDFKVEYRLLEGSKVVWEKEEMFNESR